MKLFIFANVLLIINLLSVLGEGDYVHQYSRALTPSNPGGNGNNHGDKTPVPNPSDPILNPVNNRGIRIRVPADRHPELPRNHQNRPYSATMRPPRHLARIEDQKKEDKGKGKMKEDEQQTSRKKRKADEMTHDREASTSKARKPNPAPAPAPPSAPAPAPAPPASSPPYRSRRSRYRTEEQRRNESKFWGHIFNGIATGVSTAVGAVYEAGKWAYGKAKDTCNAACQNARQKARQLRLRMLGPKHRTRPLQRYRPKPRPGDDSGGSSQVGIVKKNGQLRRFTVRYYDRTRLVHPDTYQQTVPDHWRRPTPPSQGSSSSSGVYTSSWSDPVPDHPTSSSSWSETAPDRQKLRKSQKYYSIYPPSASTGSSSVNDQESHSKSKRPRSNSTSSDASSSSTKSPPLKKRLRSSKKS